MKNYMIVFIVDKRIEPSEEQTAAWGAWFNSLGDKLVDGGNPFNPESEAHIKNGVVTMEADNVAGYNIVKANDLKEAVAMAMECPLAKHADASVKVYETMPM